MDMKRKWILVSVFTVALAAVISGCGNDDKNDNDSKDGKVQLRFATWDVAEDMDRQQKLVDEFNKAHENIEVITIQKSAQGWVPAMPRILCICGIILHMRMVWNRLSLT